MTELVHLDVADGIGTITLDSQENRNALSVQLMSELIAHLRSCAEDPAVRAIVLTHAGKVFCAGADLKAASTGGMNSGSQMIEMLRTIASTPKPVIVLARGPVRAGGLGIVGAADIAIVADDQTFAFTEARLGLTPAIISLTTLPVMDKRLASRWYLTGETFSGADAERSGLVSRAVPADQLDAVLRETLDGLLQASPQGLAKTKELLGRELVAHLDEHGAAMVELSESLFGSEEAREGMLAFREKRKPAWQQ
ncbi:enoyl-CoA hydratase family protein [Cumulibacter manganitolerans]|uniref:enoyl-CoA hydratase family protein n=1 Tax=Cumulibacter manganitolerans TaxID=1884992 RepID=UPI001296FC13|nr:enoyl-CoA hydratase family protein [Cumulibacter manganitolerans]